MKLIEDWKLAKAEYELAKERMDALRFEIIESLGCDFRGEGIVVKERFTVGPLDTSALEEALGCKVDIFRKPSRRSVVVELSRRASDHVTVKI